LWIPHAAVLRVGAVHVDLAHLGGLIWRCLIWRF
jgi:hypothetical protein